jgi:hypothetical protein
MQIDLIGGLGGWESAGLVRRARRAANPQFFVHAQYEQKISKKVTRSIKENSTLFYALMRPARFAFEDFFRLALLPGLR